MGEKVSELFTRLTVLEEFVKAYLWQENLIDNFGAMAKDGKSVDADAEEFNRRTERLRNALVALPDDLFDEVIAEDDVIYAEINGWKKSADNKRDTSDTRPE